MPPLLAPRGAPPSFVPPTVVRIPLSALLLHPLRRQNQAPTIPGNYNTSGPDPGVVVGITLGSVGAFLLVLYLFYTCVSFGNPHADIGAESTFGGSALTSRTSHTRRRSHRHRSHRRSSSARRATVIVEEEVRAAEPRLERVVVEERRRSVSRAPPPRVVRDSDVGDSEDEVVVIEDNSPPRRRRSRRRSSGERRESVYREVDPDRYAGGDVPMREVRRPSQRRSESRR